MAMTNPTPGSRPGSTASARRGQLALALQETLTATVRLRANRQVAADAESFRMQVKRVLSAAEQEARRVGYASEEVRYVLYAVVAFLDESVLNSTQPMFADWQRKPLQDEIFGGGHVGGEVFFQNLRQLLARQDSEDLADVLEVHLLCMELGFHGRYSAADSGELQMLMSRTAEKIARVRGGIGDLSPSWAPPQDEITVEARDPWMRRLGYAGAAMFGFACVLFIVYYFALHSGLSDLRAIALAR
jgi:type VI secretion system protein ImpK